MTFQATNLEYWVEGKVQTVFFGNEAEELVLLLSNVPDTSNHYLEWNEQSNAHINAVKVVQLTRNDITLELTTEAAAQFGQESFQVRFDCEDALFEGVSKVLSSILGKKIKISGGKPAKKATATKDYSTIKYLNLEGKNLKTLPEYVTEMTALETVKLRRNPKLDLHQAFTVLSQFPGLKFLECSTEQSIPEVFGALRSLESVHIDIDNPSQPCTLPESISHLRNLKYCFIQTDYEIVLPESFALLENLENCYIRAGKWNLPQQFHRLNKLTQLDFTHCTFHSLPAEMAGMANVQKVILGSAESRDYPQVMSVLAQLPQLKTMEINFPEVPAAIGLCRQIEKLMLWAGRQNPLVFPEELFSMHQLKTLLICLSKFTDIPDSIRNLKNLKELIIQESVFERLPDAIGDLAELEFLNLSENPELTRLPESIGKLSNLKTLCLADNPRLTVLPESLKNLPNLESVVIPDRSAIKNIPAHWEKLFN